MHQPRSALGHEQKQPEAGEAAAEAGSVDEDGQKSRRDESKESEVVVGLDVEEVFVTEKHEGRKDKISKSANSRIGAPASMPIRYSVSEGNEISGSPNSNIGRF